MDESKAVAMYTKQDKSTYEIAEYFNTYPNKVRRVLLRNGVILKDKSAAQKNAIGKGVAKHPTAGKKRTDAEKLKISSGLQKYWENMSEEEYNLKVEQSRERWNNLSESDRKTMQDAAIKSIQLAGKEGSKIEKFLYEELLKEGYKVDYHKKQLIQNENLEIDMSLPTLKTIIEVDGPSHFLPIWGDEKLQKQIKADYHKTGLILGKGFVIIRIKNLSDSTSLAKKAKLVSDVLEILKKIEKSFPPKSERLIEVEA